MPRNGVRYSLDFNLLVFENPVHKYISQGFLGHPKRWYRARIVHDRTFIVFNHSKACLPLSALKILQLILNMFPVELVSLIFQYVYEVGREEYKLHMTQYSCIHVSFRIQRIVYQKSEVGI